MDYASEDQEYKYVAEIEAKEQVNALASSGHPNNVFATVLVSGTREKFQLDSGWTVNIMTGGWDSDKALWPKQLAWIGRNPCDVQPVRGQTPGQEGIQSRKPQEK